MRINVLFGFILFHLAYGCIKYTISGWELLITFFVFNKCSTWAQQIALLPLDIYIAFKWSLLFLKGILKYWMHSEA